MSTATSPQSIPPSSSRPNLWIANWWQDLLWIVGPPLFLVPLFSWLGQSLTLERLSVLVITFGAVGHHLPGMLRAYGDAELFSRYRVRFILAPIVFISVSIAYSFYRPDVLKVVILSWGFWHSQAQIYGFLRIYDAKAGFTDRKTALLDRLLCLSWFTGGVVMSTGRVSSFLTTYYKAGGPTISSAIIHNLQSIVLGVMGLSLLLFIIHTAIVWQKAKRASLIKLFMLALSIGFWWYCMVMIQNVILGVALYEVFHDVQYLAIVWLFNRRRATTNPSAGWFTQFLFQPRVRFLCLYVGLVFLYGAGSLLTRSLEPSVLQTILTGLYAASGLLHFYYDGFIWRIREKETSEALNVRGVQRILGPHTRRTVRQAALWSLFVTPLLLLSLTPEGEEPYQKVVVSLPESHEGQFYLASDLRKQGDLSGAEEHVRKSLEINPSFGDGWALLGEILLSQQQNQKAIAALKRAVELEPLNAGAHFNLGSAYIHSQQIKAGTEAYLTAIDLDEKLTSGAFNNLGSALLELKAADDAELAFERAIEANPENIDALYNQAQLQAQLGRTSKAVELYQRTLQIDAGFVPGYSALVKLLIVSDHLPQAEQIAKEFLDHHPKEPDAYCSLGLLYTKQKRFAEAESAFQQALTLQPEHFPSNYGLALMQFEQNQPKSCLKVIESIRQSQSLTTAQTQNLDRLQNQVEAQL